MRSLFRLLWAVLMLAAASAAGAAPAHDAFGSPEEASKALFSAAAANNANALLAVLGARAQSVVFSGDAVADRAARERFVQAYGEARKLERIGESKAVLSVGKDEWPFPIPIVKTSKGWRFDARQGGEELLNRRIGRNELAVIEAVQAYVDAQREYYLLNPQHDRVLSYAPRLVSTTGKRDGLYYPTKDAEPPSPLGPLFAAAQARGYKLGAGSKPGEYHGYYYRILKAQGSHASGGAYDYVVRGKMIGGFALVAWPASYANSGVMTFIVNHDGVVYQNDLGPGTAAAVQKMKKFDPDPSWTRP